jgi:hypothetical protein
VLFVPPERGSGHIFSAPAPRSIARWASATSCWSRLGPDYQGRFTIIVRRQFKDEGKCYQSVKIVEPVLP